MVRSAYSMTTVEQYHAPNLRGFSTAHTKAPDHPKEDTQKIAAKSIKDSDDSSGLAQTLVIFGALLRLGLPNNAPTPSKYKRTVAF